MKDNVNMSPKFNKIRGRSLIYLILITCRGRHPLIWFVVRPPAKPKNDIITDQWHYDKAQKTKPRRVGSCNNNVSWKILTIIMNYKVRNRHSVSGYGRRRLDGQDDQKRISNICRR